MIQVDHGIPIPPPQPRGRSPGIKNYCPWDKLKVGDSFAYPPACDWRMTRIHAVNQILARKKWDRNTYVARRMPDTDVVRIWRVS